MTTQNDDMTETVVNAGDTVKTDDIELEAPKNAMATARRLFVQLGNQRVRLCVVAASILLFTFFHIAAPMYSAVVVDSIWDAVQGAWRDGVPFSVSWNAGGIGWTILILAILALRKQKVAESVLKSLQTRPGVHGELLERMLPTRDELRRLYQQQRQPSTGNISHPALDSVATTHADPFGIGIEIDLFSDTPMDTALDDVPQVQSDVETNTVFARQVLRFWINHMRNLPDNAPLVELLGLSKQTLEMLMEEVITAGLRQGISQALHLALNQDDHPSAYTDNEIDSQVSRALTVLGDFIAWLGFQKIAEEQRPESRINRGRKIFAKPEKQAISWGAAKRLTKLSLTPTNNTAFYVYDWLVGLNTLILQNAGHSAGGELDVEQRKQLGTILQIFKPTPTTAK